LALAAQRSTIKDLLRELILFFSHQQEVNLPETVDSLILMEYLRSSRCLLVLDNGESILRSGERLDVIAAAKGIWTTTDG